MANLTISALKVRVNGAGSFVTPSTSSPTKVRAGNILNVNFALKNNSNSNVNEWSVKYTWSYNGATVSTGWLYGSSSTRGTTSGFGGKLGTYASRTLTLNIDTRATGLDESKHADKLTLAFYTFYSTSQGTYSAIGSASYASNTNAIQYIGESHLPFISEFSVKRNGNETPQLIMSAKGGYQIPPPQDATFGEQVTLKYSINGGATWSNVPPADMLTVSDLLSGVKNRIMSLTIPTTQSATFRLEFWNEFETRAKSEVKVSPAFANLHLAGYKSGGVAVGQFSTSSNGYPKFECAYPAFFREGYKDYSTEDIVVGRWINGKPIYRIVSYDDTTYSFPQGADTTRQVPTHATNVDMVISLNVMRVANTGAYYPVPLYNATASANWTLSTANLTNDVSQCGMRYYGYAAQSGVKFVIILEYTKTTDIAPASIVGIRLRKDNMSGNFADWSDAEQASINSFFSSVSVGDKLYLAYRATCTTNSDPSSFQKYGISIKYKNGVSTEYLLDELVMKVGDYHQGMDFRFWQSNMAGNFNFLRGTAGLRSSDSAAVGSANMDYIIANLTKTFGSGDEPGWGDARIDVLEKYLYNR